MLYFVLYCTVLYCTVPVFVLVPVLGHDVVPVHGVVVSAPVLHVPGLTLQLVHVGGHDSLEGVTHHEELQRLRQELLEQVLGEQRVLLPEEGVQTQPVILGDLM